MIIRDTITLPGAGSKTERQLDGRELIVEYSPDETVADVPLIRFDNPNGEAVPAYTGIHIKRCFDRFYVEGTAATGDLSVIVVTSKGVQIDYRGNATG